MEEELLTENQKESESNSFLENKKKNNIKLSRIEKRLNTMTLSTNLTGKNSSIRTLKQSPKSRNVQRKNTIFSTFNNYNKSANKIKSIKIHLQSNISPTLSTYSNEKEITQSNLEKQKMQNLQKKIFNLYNSYYKAYTSQASKNKANNLKSFKTKNNNITSINNKTFLFPLKSSTIESVKKKKLSKKKKFSRSIGTKSKTIKATFKTSFNLQTPKIKERKKTHIFFRTEPDEHLRQRVKDLVKEIDYKKRNQYIPRVKTKEGRVKLVSLLNKNEGMIDEVTNFLTKKKMTKNDLPMLRKKPTNNIEMNNLIINSFGVGHNHIEFSKKLYDLNEVFFSLMENMKEKRAEMDNARFEKEKRKYEDKDSHKINYELYFQRNNRDKWEKKFMLDQYEYKIPEKEFKNFKKFERAQNKKTFIENAKKLSYLITKLDSDEYEIPDDISHNYRSTKSHISSINYKRISRLLKILKNIEDEEQTGNIILKADYLKKEQQMIENEMINIIGKSGKPRFVKNLLKPKTITKYKSISGNFFGLTV